MITLIFMVYCVLFLKLKKKKTQTTGKAVIKFMRAVFKYLKAVNVDGRLNLC